MSSRSFEFSGAFRRTEQGNVDHWYGGGGIAWPTIQAALDNIPLVIRPGKVIGVAEDGQIVEYIWHPNNTTNTGIKRIGVVGSEGKFSANNITSDDNSIVITPDENDPHKAHMDISLPYLKVRFASHDEIQEQIKTTTPTKLSMFAKK